MKKQHKIAYLILLVITIFLFISCGEGQEKVGIKPIEVNAKTIKRTDVSSQLEYPGTIEGESRVKLSTKLMGEITYFPFEAGSKIKKDQLLAEINSGDITAKEQQVKANIIQAEAAFKNAETNYERIKNLYDKNSATKKEMEDVQMGYDMAKAGLDAAREMKNEIGNILSYSKIRAPFDGYIVNKFFEEGDITAPGQPLMIVENYKSFKVTTMVSSSDINLFSIGQGVSVIVDAVQNNAYNGKVIEVNPSGNAYSKQFEVKVSIEKKLHETLHIKSGMYATIVLNNKTKPVITIDENVLVKRGQLIGVYSVSDNNEALLRWIRLGKMVNGRYEVLSGLSEGDVIITDKEKVKDGQKVKVI